MGSIANGLAVHGGITPFTATFLIFSDYMRPPIRLAALMEQKVIFVFTHDSIALGQDGPTHQPIEHLAALRTIPHLFVIRPADSAEVSEAWRIAILRRHAPTALALTRQKVPVIDRNKFSKADGLRRGAYVLADSEAPKLILMATGSEVSLVLDAWQKLQDEGVAARVVSMPCWELFEEQPQEYRDQVLSPAVTARLAVEAGVRQGWDRYVGPKGDVICLDRFGASAPGDVVLKNLGFNVDNVLERARRLLQ
jgi:transketolase